MTGIRFRGSLAATLLITAQVAHAAPEYIQSEQTAPGSVDESVESAEYAFRPPGRARAISRLGQVFREGTFDLQLRNYYFHREREDETNPETWAQGGSLGYESPWWTRTAVVLLS